MYYFHTVRAIAARVAWQCLLAENRYIIFW